MYINNYFNIAPRYAEPITCEIAQLYIIRSIIEKAYFKSDMHTGSYVSWEQKVATS